MIKIMEGVKGMISMKMKIVLPEKKANLNHLSHIQGDQEVEIIIVRKIISFEIIKCLLLTAILLVNKKISIIITLIIQKKAVAILIIIIITTINKKISIIPKII